jgi:hypothetical protein
MKGSLDALQWQFTLKDLTVLLLNSVVNQEGREGLQIILN